MRAAPAETETEVENEAVVLPEIGRYQLVAELAQGGMGVVHLAVAHGPAGFTKLLAIKELRPELACEDGYVAMFLEEARLAARLQHKNVVQTFEVGWAGDRPYMVMELLDGRSLGRILRKLRGTERLPLAAHLRIIAEMLEGLHHAHELRDFDGQPVGVVHRDVSPLNVFVTFDGQVKVVDFGIAKAVDSSLETKTGIVKGRIAYMAPEQAWGTKVDRRADIYSVGVMLWEAVAGRRLWHGLHEVELLNRVLREGAPPPSSVCADVPEDLEAICARALKRHPEDRYATAAELLDDLEAHIASRSDATTMREVGALVADAFAEERREMNAVIEEALARARTGPRSGVVPAFERPSAAPPSLVAEPEEPSDVSLQFFVRTSANVPVEVSTQPPPAPAPVASGLARYAIPRQGALAGLAAGALLSAAIGFVVLRNDGGADASTRPATGSVATAQAQAAPQAPPPRASAPAADPVGPARAGAPLRR